MAKKLDTRLLEATVQEAKREVDKVTRLPINRDAIGTPSGQGRDTVRAPPGHHRGALGTPSGQGRDRVTIGTPSGKPITLPKQQARIYDWLLANGPKGLFNKGMIYREIGIAYTTARKTIRRFVKLGLISLEYDESLRAFEYELNTKIPLKRERIGTGSGQDRDRVGTPLLEEEEKNLLLEKIEVIFPNLHGIGFERSQLRDVIQSWKMLKLDLNQLPESLLRADYAIVNKSFKMDDPLSYIYKSLMKGSFRKPQGFKSREELQAEEVLAEQKHIADMKEDAFQLWCDNLPLEKRAEYCNGVPRIKQRAHLREVFDRRHSDKGG